MARATWPAPSGGQAALLRPRRGQKLRRFRQQRPRRRRKPPRRPRLRRPHRLLLLHRHRQRRTLRCRRQIEPAAPALPDPPPVLPPPSGPAAPEPAEPPAAQPSPWPAPLPLPAPLGTLVLLEPAECPTPPGYDPSPPEPPPAPLGFAWPQRLAGAAGSESGPSFTQAVPAVWQLPSAGSPATPSPGPDAHAVSPRSNPHHPATSIAALLAFILPTSKGLPQQPWCHRGPWIVQEGPLQDACAHSPRAERGRTWRGRRPAPLAWRSGRGPDGHRSAGPRHSR
jgi:hypothetical protein